jgi:hypothetical protein
MQAEKDERARQRVAALAAFKANSERINNLPISAESVKEYYANWNNGVAIKNGGAAYLDFKARLIKHLLKLAENEKWLVWRRDIVLYIETPYGQCSFHVVPIRMAGFHPLPEWFLTIQVQNKKWSGKRDSDLVIRRLLGDKSVGRKIKRPKQLWMKSFV